MKYAIPILMPQLGQTVEEATLVRWVKKQGENIKQGDILFELETDKAILESESFQDGILLKIIVNENELVPVKSVVGYVGEKGDKIPLIRINNNINNKNTEIIQAYNKENTINYNIDNNIDIIVNNNERNNHKIQKNEEFIFNEITKVFISPRAKYLCKIKCIEFLKIKGTGPGNRIIEKDVVNYMIKYNYHLIKITPSAKNLVINKKIDLIKLSNYYRKKRIYLNDVYKYIQSLPQPMTNNRKILSKRLTNSFKEIPHFNLTVSVDMTEIVEIKKRYNYKKKIYTLNSFIMKAAILSLNKYTIINSMTPDGENIEYKTNINLGIAVEVNNSLMVPVIFNANYKSILQIHNEVKELINKANNNKLSPTDLNDSTFTISNLGMNSVDEFNAIINPGNGAILAVSSIIKKPVIYNNNIEIRDMMKATLSADHRVMDGFIVAEFMNFFKNSLENTSIW